jgi:outer membrane immunogenic protein
MSLGAAACAADKFGEISMKRILGGMVVAAALSCSAFAADLGARTYAKAPAMVDPAYNWTGFYVGLNAGGAWGRTETESSPFGGTDINATAAALAQTAGASTSTGSGFIGGAQIGYNWQAANWVVGLEADVQGLNFKQTRTSPVVSLAGNSAQDFDEVKHSFLSTFRGRLGFAWDRSLIYATGGVAITDSSFSRTQTWAFGDRCPIAANGFEACHVGSAKSTAVGAVLGAGWEYAFAGHWSVKAEYLHVWSPNVQFVTTNPDVTGQHILQSAKTSNLDIARLGLNYNFGGPVLDK